MGPLSNEHLPASLSEYFGGKLDEFRVSVRHTDGNLHEVVRIQDVRGIDYWR